MKERLEEIEKLANGIMGGMDSHVADGIRLAIQAKAKEVRDMLENRSRVK